MNISISKIIKEHNIEIDYNDKTGTVHINNPQMDFWIENYRHCGNTRLWAVMKYIARLEATP